MRRVAAFACVVSLAVVACTSGEPSRVDRDAEIVVSGRVLDDAGQPVKGAAVAVSSFGALSDWIPFACLASCDFDETVPTVSDGSFEVRMRGQDTQTAIGGERTMLARVVDDEPGDGALARAAVESYFVVRTEQVTLPELRLWRGRVELAGSGPARTVRISPVPAGAELTLVVRDTEGNELAPPAPVRDGGRFDARLLEDFLARVDVLARTKTDTVTTVQRSRVYAVRGDQVPMSRGAACRRFDRAGKPVVIRPCGVTDGDLLTVSPDDVDDCVDVPLRQETTCRTNVSALVIDLGAVKSPRQAVLRGNVFGIGLVQTSVDGRTWRESERIRPDAEARVAVVTLAPGQARYLRTFAHARSLVEVSLW